MEEYTATANCPYEGIAPMSAEDMAEATKNLSPNQKTALEAFISGMKAQEAMAAEKPA